jgi:hypothetical protein
MISMDDNHSAISQHQAEYYGELYEKFGPGVNAVASGQQVYKNLRYKKLSAVFQNDDNFEIHDVGFGLGHYFEYLLANYPDKRFVYSGSEITSQFVEFVHSKYPALNVAIRDLADGPFLEMYDYLIFGGTFYHQINENQDEFMNFVQKLLINGFKSARKGIAFNLITKYVDYKSEGLFFADINVLTDFVANNLSRFFTIDHASPLYEYTICVYHEDHISKNYPEPEFNKYFRLRK